MAELLRPNIADEVRGPVGVAVGVTVETGDAAARLLRAPIFSDVELLLGERSQQQPQTFQLLRIQNAVEQLVKVFDGDQLALRHVAQVGPRREINGRRKLGQEVFRQIELEVEAIKIAPFLFEHFLDVGLGEDHAPFGMMRMG